MCDAILDDTHKGSVINSWCVQICPWAIFAQTHAGVSGFVLGAFWLGVTWVYRICPRAIFGKPEAECAQICPKGIFAQADGEGSYRRGGFRYLDKADAGPSSGQQRD